MSFVADFAGDVWDATTDVVDVVVDAAEWVVDETVDAVVGTVDAVADIAYDVVTLDVEGLVDTAGNMVEGVVHTITHPTEDPFATIMLAFAVYNGYQALTAPPTEAAIYAEATAAREAAGGMGTSAGNAAYKAVIDAAITSGAIDAPSVANNLSVNLQPYNPLRKVVL